MIDLSKLRDFDILLMSGGDILAKLIRCFEIETADMREGHPLKGIIDGLREATDNKIPIHSRMVYNASAQLGCEMTWPKARFCDLKPDVGEIVAVFRCPMLWNADNSRIIRDDINKWWNAFISGRAYYGIDNLVLFPTNLPVDQNHLVCSMATSHSLMTCLNNNGVDVLKLFPSYWMVAGKDHSIEPGKISPYDQDVEFTNLKWEVV